MVNSVDLESILLQQNPELKSSLAIAETIESEYAKEKIAAVKKYGWDEVSKLSEIKLDVEVDQKITAIDGKIRPLFKRILRLQNRMYAAFDVYSHLLDKYEKTED